MNSVTAVASWEEWLAEHTGRFLFFARQQTRTEADAEDVLQDALVETWRRTGGRPDVTLVYATIRRRAIDLARATDRRAVREQAVAAPAAAWFDTAVHQRETTALLEQALRALPEEQRLVVTLKDWGGLTFAEVATALDIPPGTAASRHRLAVAKLRELLLPAFS